MARNPAAGVRALSGRLSEPRLVGIVRAAKRTPSEEAGQARDPLAHLEAATADVDHPETLVMVAVPHLDDTDRSPDLGFQLDVTEEHHVLEEERQPPRGPVPGPRPAVSLVTIRDAPAACRRPRRPRE